VAAEVAVAVADAWPLQWLLSWLLWQVAVSSIVTAVVAVVDCCSRYYNGCCSGYSKGCCGGCSSDSRVANVVTAAVAVAWSLQWFLPRLVVYSGFCDDCCSGGIEMLTSMVAISLTCVGCFGDYCSDFYSHCYGDCFSGN